MPLNAQMVSIPLAQGVSTKQDAKQVPLGKLLTLENGFFQTPGEIRKRYGFDGLGQTTFNDGVLPVATLDSSRSVFSYQDQLLISSPTNATYKYRGRHLYSYNQTYDQWSPIRGAFVEMQVGLEPIASSRLSQEKPDSASVTDGNVKLSAWISNGQVYYSIIDTTTGNTIRTAASGAANMSLYAKTIVFNGNLVLLQSGSAGRVDYTAFSATTLAVVSSGTVTSNILGAAPIFDAAASATRLYVAFNYKTTGVGAVYLDTAWTPSTEVVAAAHAATLAIGVAVHATAGSFGIGYSDGAAVYSLVYTATLTGGAAGLVETTATVNQIGIVTGTSQIVSPAFFRIFYCHYVNNSTTNSIYTGTLSSSGGSGGTLFQRGCSLASKPFNVGYNTFMLGLYGGAVGTQPTFFVFMYQETSYVEPINSVVGKACASVAYDASRVGNLPEVTQSTSGVYEIAVVQNNGSAEFTIVGAIWGLTLNFNVTAQSATIANTLHMTGGQLWMFDNQACVEHGFHLYPEIASATPSGVAGPFPANTTYQYVALYEWLDAQGQIHRSAPSLPVSVTTGGSGAASIAVPVSYLRVTNKILNSVTTNDVNVFLYRTAGNGTIFYKLASDVNVPTAASGTFTDTSADASIIGNTQLYTTGGQVENSSAPPCLDICTYKSRLIVVPSDSPYSWWFSQEVIPTSASTVGTPVELSEFFIKNIDQDGGGITAVDVMDDKLVIFKRTRPYYVVGNGPAPNGVGDDYQPAQAVLAPVGAVYAGSVSQSPMGLMFQASDNSGLWLLDRSLGTSYIGADVEAYNAQNVTSAVQYPDYNQVRFTMSGGVCLVYDYFVQQWAISTNIAATQAVLFQGAFTYARAATGLVLQEDTSTFTDNGTFVQLKIGTSWLQLAGLQGFQRVYEVLVLGDYQTAHSLIAKVYYDFEPSATQTTTIVPTATPPYEWRLLLKRQKCEAMKIELYDTQVSPAEGMRLSAIALWVGAKYGLNKMAASRSFD